MIFLIAKSTILSSFLLYGPFPVPTAPAVPEPVEMIKIQIHILLILMIAAGRFSYPVNNNFHQQVEFPSGGQSNAKILENGNLLTLTLDRNSGSGFKSKNRYLFGKVDIQIKLVPGNSAGTVTAYYMCSEKPDNRDEIDMEFLGNLSGDPYTLHTNIYTRGKGEREQQFRLWFDPTKAFHTYSILWNPFTILISVDGIPIREYRNFESRGIPFPKTQPMKLYSSIWNADDWATRGGLVKTDWTKAPFIASYRNLNTDACVWYSRGLVSCSTSFARVWRSKAQLNSVHYQRLKWVQKKHMIYNYCTDSKRFPRGFPPECSLINA